MCVVVYKPKNVKLPSEKRLQACFETNPDGAGYMYPDSGKVRIKKGFMKFNDFYKSLIEDYGDDGDQKDFVLHFRISTQGGVNQRCCHPFPVSKKMEDLYLTDCESEIGVAHNGIISLTSEYSSGYYATDQYGITRYYEKDKIEYSDTMKFITDYLSLILRNKEDMQDISKAELINKLIGTSNKLAIMSTDSTKIIGNFEEFDGVFYSNSYFIYREDSYWKNYKTLKSQIVDSDTSLDDDDDDDMFDRDEYPVLDDMSFSPDCGKAKACRKCMQFEYCYGESMPIEWETMTDEEIDEEIKAFYGGYYDT